MSQEKFSRSAAITSQVIIILWLAVQLLAGIFKNPLIEPFYYHDDITKINSWAVIVLCAGSLCMTAANFMICMKKYKNAPLLLSAIAGGLLPIAVRIAYVAQRSSLTSMIAEFQTLSVYETYIVHPLSYMLYAGTVVTIAAAAVYAFGNSEAFPRKTSIASQIVLIVWLALQLLSSIFQKNALKLFIAMNEQLLDEVGKVTSYAAVVLCLGSLLILAANVLICSKKGKLSPLLISSITIELLPISAGRVMQMQNILAGYDSSDAVYVVGAYNSLVSMLSYLFYFGAVLAITAAAVNLFAEAEAKAENYSQL